MILIRAKQAVNFEVSSWNRAELIKWLEIKVMVIYTKYERLFFLIFLADVSLPELH